MTLKFHAKTHLNITDLSIRRIRSDRIVNVKSSSCMVILAQGMAAMWLDCSPSVRIPASDRWCTGSTTSLSLVNQLVDQGRTEEGRR